MNSRLFSFGSRPFMMSFTTVVILMLRQCAMCLTGSTIRLTFSTWRVVAYSCRTSGISEAILPRLFASRKSFSSSVIATDIMDQRGGLAKHRKDLYSQPPMKSVVTVPIGFSKTMSRSPARNCSSSGTIATKASSDLKQVDIKLAVRSYQY